MYIPLEEFMDGVRNVVLHVNEDGSHPILVVSSLDDMHNALCWLRKQQGQLRLAGLSLPHGPYNYSKVSILRFLSKVAEMSYLRMRACRLPDGDDLEQEMTLGFGNFTSRNDFIYLLPHTLKMLHVSAGFMFRLNFGLRLGELPLLEDLTLDRVRGFDQSFDANASRFGPLLLVNLRRFNVPIQVARLIVAPNLKEARFQPSEVFTFYQWFPQLTNLLYVVEKSAIFLHTTDDSEPLVAQDAVLDTVVDVARMASPMLTELDVGLLLQDDLSYFKFHYSLVSPTDKEKIRQLYRNRFAAFGSGVGSPIVVQNGTLEATFQVEDDRVGFSALNASQDRDLAFGCSKSRVRLSPRNFGQSTTSGYHRSHPMSVLSGLAEAVSAGQPLDETL